MRAWFEKRQAQLLPCGYFHLVATVPEPIRAAFLADQKTLYGLFMQTVAHSVMDLARDERFVGATPAILMVLHTWTGQLHYHPHVHLLVSAGGISEDSQHWREPKNKDFLVPVKALSGRIRRRFAEELKRLKPDLYASLPPETWTKGWNTFCKPYGQGAEVVLRYLARYVFRTAITNARIVDMQDEHITFRYKDRATSRWRHCRLHDFEFLDRFLRHVLPKGFHKVRYYGLWHHSQRARQQALRLLQIARREPEHTPTQLAGLSPEAEALAAGDEPQARGTDFKPACPRCGCEQVIHLEELKRSIDARRTRAGP